MEALMIIGSVGMLAPWGIVEGSRIVKDRIESFKVGGMRFVKIRYWGNWKLCVSWCVTTK